MIIDETYFIFDINVPQNFPNIQYYIDRYEKEILVKGLGYQLYKDFTEGLAQETIDQKWLDLRDGKDYEIDGVLVHWNGLANEEKKSLIAYYVYYWIRRNSVSVMGNNGGQMINDFENAGNTDSLLQQSIAWNEMLELYGVVPEINYNVIDNLGNKFFIPNNTTAITYEPTLFNFLAYSNRNETVYHNWVFTPLEAINSWVI